jgi:protein-disulfide isomerase
MKRKHGWLVALVAAALLVAACGPAMSTPTPGATATSAATATAVSSQPTQSTQPTQPAVSVASLVDPSDWHVLGSADAPVTLIEFTDFQ